MKMKPILVTLLLIACVLVSYAQKGKVTSALNYVASGQLDKAKEAIEAAEQNEKTKDWEKMFYAKGKVLQAVGESQDENYKNLYEDPFQQAYKYYMEALERDEKGQLDKLVNLALPMLANDFINLGFNKFQEGDYAAALEAFETNLKIGELPVFGEGVDTAIIFNAGLAAYNGDLHEKAIEHFSTVKDMDYDDYTLYILLKNSYVALGDSAGVLGVLQEGFSKFPDNESLLIELVYYYIMKGGPDAAQEAMDYIGLAKEQEPSNAFFSHAEGILYDKMGNIDKSIESYEKALELNPDFFDSNYNLGAHHFNKGVTKMNEECIEIMNNAEYEKCKAEADAMFNLALPYMEKAFEINPTDKSTLETLKLLYYRMGDMKKHEEMDKRIKELQFR